LDEFIVMPNHIHGIIVIQNPVGANNYSPHSTTDVTNTDGTIPNGAIPNGAIPNGAIPNGAIPNGAIPNGAIPNGANNYSPLRIPPDRICGTSKTVGSMVRGFKIGVTKWFRENGTNDTVWQRNYYDHIIRDTRSLYNIRKYILENPAQWELDSRNHIDREIDEWGFA
jgi:putative transposase